MLTRSNDPVSHRPGRRQFMSIDVRAQTLVKFIEGRLTEISERQHALAAEKTQLQEQITPLRLGIVSPNVALAQLKEKGIALRGFAVTLPAGRRPRGVILKAVRMPRPIAAFSMGRSQSSRPEPLPGPPTRSRTGLGAV
jgi:hypothetical protein